MAMISVWFNFFLFWMAFVLSLSLSCLLIILFVYLFIVRGASHIHTLFIVFSSLLIISVSLKLLFFSTLSED